MHRLIFIMPVSAGRAFPLERDADFQQNDTQT